MRRQAASIAVSRNVAGYRDRFSREWVFAAALVSRGVLNLFGATGSTTKRVRTPPLFVIRWAGVRRGDAAPTGAGGASRPGCESSAYGGAGRCGWRAGSDAKRADDARMHSATRRLLEELTVERAELQHHLQSTSVVGDRVARRLQQGPTSQRCAMEATLTRETMLDESPRWSR